ncbi:MAG TPA: glycosyltransferase family 9 protein [Acidimicrobiales bacterium]|nr:glycosyltransferase family 9 protein [Acidimicrobiales bacterium]
MRRQPVLVVLRALGLGDLCTAVPALRALADAYPRHRRVLLTTAGVAPLAAAAGLADEVVTTEDPRSRVHSVRKPHAMYSGSVDVAVNLHGKGPESHRALLAAGPRRLIAFGTAGVPGPAWRADEHEVHRWCRLLRESGVPADPGRLDLDLPAAPVPDGVAGSTVVHPGAAYPARRWPAARWAAVARAEASAGRAVVVTGGASEAGLARGVAAAAGLPSSAVLAGATGVVELAAVVGAAGRVVCGDTGVAHLATALRRPSVVLFGPVPPSLWGPPPDRPWHTALWAGRTGDPWAASVDGGLLEIGVDDVLAALDGLPAAEPVAAAPA